MLRKILDVVRCAFDFAWVRCAAPAVEVADLKFPSLDLQPDGTLWSVPAPISGGFEMTLQRRGAGLYPRMRDLLLLTVVLSGCGPPPYYDPIAYRRCLNEAEELEIQVTFDGDVPVFSWERPWFDSIFEFDVGSIQIPNLVDGRWSPDPSSTPIQSPIQYAVNPSTGIFDPLALPLDAGELFDIVLVLNCYNESWPLAEQSFIAIGPGIPEHP